VVVSNVLAYCAVSDHDRCPFPPDFPRFAYMIPPVGWTVGVRLFAHSHLLSPPVHFHCYPFLYALVTSCAFYEWPYDPLEYGMSAFGGFETLALTVILMPIFTATRFYLPLSRHVRFFFCPVNLLGMGCRCSVVSKPRHLLSSLRIFPLLSFFYLLVSPHMRFMSGLMPPLNMDCRPSVVSKHRHLLSSLLIFSLLPFFLSARVTSCAFRELPYTPLEYGMSTFGGF
jgi:hypothetical protein